MKEGSILFCPNDQLKSANELRDFIAKHKYNWNLLLIDQHPALEQKMDLLVRAFIESGNVREVYRDLVTLVNGLIVEFELTAGVAAMINDLVVEIEWIIEDDVHDSDQYLTDQLTAYGSLISSGLPLGIFDGLQWVDARDHLVTDDKYGHASVKGIKPMLNKREHPIVSQMYLGVTTENNSTLIAKDESVQDYWDQILNNI